MPRLTPAHVLNTKFHPTKFRQGYTQDDVDEFLDEVVTTMVALEQRANGGPTKEHSSLLQPGEVPEVKVTSQSVMNKSFSTSKFREGYDMDEVDTLMDDIATTLQELEAQAAGGGPAGAAAAGAPAGGPWGAGAPETPGNPAGPWGSDGAAPPNGQAREAGANGAVDAASTSRLGVVDGAPLAGAPGGLPAGAGAPGGSPSGANGAGVGAPDAYSGAPTMTAPGQSNAYAGASDGVGYGSPEPRPGASRDAGHASPEFYLDAPSPGTGYGSPDSRPGASHGTGHASPDPRPAPAMTTPGQQDAPLGAPTTAAYATEAPAVTESSSRLPSTRMGRKAARAAEMAAGTPLAGVPTGNGGHSGTAPLGLDANHAGTAIAQRDQYIEQLQQENAYLRAELEHAQRRLSGSNY